MERHRMEGKAEEAGHTKGMKLGQGSQSGSHGQSFWMPLW